MLIPAQVGETSRQTEQRCLAGSTWLITYAMTIMTSSRNVNKALLFYKKDDNSEMYSQSVIQIISNQEYPPTGDTNLINCVML